MEGAEVRSLNTQSEPSFETLCRFRRAMSELIELRLKQAPRSGKTLAAKLGVSPDDVTAMMAEETITLESFARLCDALNIRPYLTYVLLAVPPAPHR